MAREVSGAEVRHMAMLSRLCVSSQEEALFRRQFGQILDHVAVLEQVDTEGIEPLYNPVQHPGLQRLDEARDLRNRTEILANAPETDGQSFVVPRIV
ncbi:MAG: Asp-tRNA(Asn)/Glu-tRNA(Gln) amidotransferase subunit GatC [Desulfovibrio sp.]|nr:Asp-tRNA(Asn)/Glu-tRNA(Gln) amidotransferase subunit GatC [Desulfovibrio sp.]